MSALGNLVVNLAMRTAEFESGTNRATYLTNKLERDIEKSMKRITTQAAAIGTAIGQFAYQMGRSFVQSVSGAINAADELNAMSQKTGIAIGALQELQYAATLTDVPLQALANGLKFLSKNATEAAGGSKDMAQVFGAFDIKLRNSNGAVKSQMELLEDWADIFRDLPDGPEKTALAMKVFGKANEEMIPLLNKGAEGVKQLREEAQRFGVVVGDEAVKKLADFTDEIDRAKLQGTALVQNLAAEVIPWISRMLEQMVEGTRIAGGFWEAVFSFGIGGKNGAITNDNAMDKVREYGALVEQLQARLANFKENDDFSDEWAGQIRAVERELTDAMRGLKFAKVLVNQNTREQFGRQELLTDPAERDAAARRRQAQVRKALATPDTEGVRKQTQFVKELDDAWEKFQDNYRKATVEQAKGLQTMLEQNDELRREIELIGKSKVEIMLIEQARIADTIAKKEALVATMQLAGEDERHIKIIQAEIAALTERKRLSGEKFAAEVLDDAGSNRRAETDKAAKDAADAIKAREDDISRGLTDSLMRGFEGGEDAGKNFIDSLRNMFKTQALKIFIEPVMKVGTDQFAKFLSGMFSGFGGVSGAIGSGAFTADFISTGGLGYLAEGGPMQAGRPYVVGERGPELVVPSRNGYVVPNHALGGAAPITVVQHNTIDSRSDQATIHQMLEANRVRTLNDIRELQRRNDPRLVA